MNATSEAGTWAAGIRAVAGEHLKGLELAEGDRAYVAFALGHEGKEMNFREESPERGELISNIHRGMWGVDVKVGDKRAWVSPFQVIMRNRGFKVIFEELAKTLEVPVSIFNEKAEIVRWKTHQIVVSLAEARPAMAVHRASRLVRPADITREGVEALATRLGDYLFQHVDDDGALTYLYEPARGEDVDGLNNMIRQWMATVCMNRVCLLYTSPSPRD